MKERVKQIKQQMRQLSSEMAPAQKQLKWLRAELKALAKAGAAVLVLGMMALVAMGADAGTPAEIPAPTVNWVLLLIPVVVPVVLAVLKLLVPKLPKWLLPILAPLLGAAADYLMGGTFGVQTIMGAIAGSAGVGLRELADQVKKANQPTTQ